MTDWRVPLSMLDHGVEEADAAQRVIASKWLSMGHEVLAFESEFAAMHSTGHAYAGLSVEHVDETVHILRAIR